MLRDLITQYKSDRLVYPESLEALVDAGYLRHMPVDPITHRTDSWVPISNEPDFEDPMADMGIEDIQSGAVGATLDGVPYSEL